MPNLPVFKVIREDGTPGTETIHMGFSIDQNVRVSSTEQAEDYPARPETRASICRKHEREARPETREWQEISDMEYYVTHRANRRNLVSRVTAASKSVVDTENDPETEPDNDTERDKERQPELVNGIISDLEQDDYKPDHE